ncbi:MAG: peptidoglycan editing factor PgeF [Lachnospiraceae bacterium]|nr:peptidoglycan editing factor PgeF [Lachnospiraceae bacterium]
MYPVKRIEGAKSHISQNSDKMVEYLTFPGLEQLDCIKHLFSTRLGGVSEGIYSSMNLSFTRGDKEEKVFANFDRIGAVLGADREQFVLSHQTHTDNIRIVTKEDAGSGLTKPLPYQDVDGLITNEKGLVLSTFYADCVPIYLVDPVRQVIGLCHSGWKGTVAEIGKKTVDKMCEVFGCDPGDIHAAIAPSICQSCYEVSEDVIEEVKKTFTVEVYGKDYTAELFYAKPNGKYQLNLWRACELTLLRAGVAPEHIEVTDICTCCNPEYLFSHRASQGKRGNLGAFLMLRED